MSHAAGHNGRKLTACNPPRDDTSRYSRCTSRSLPPILGILQNPAHREHEGTDEQNFSATNARVVRRRYISGRRRHRYSFPGSPQGFATTGIDSRTPQSTCLSKGTLHSPEQSLRVNFQPTTAKIMRSGKITGRRMCNTQRKNSKKEGLWSQLRQDYKQELRASHFPTFNPFKTNADLDRGLQLG